MTLPSTFDASTVIVASVAPPAQAAASDQVSIMDLAGDAVRRKLEGITVETMTPIEALNTLFELKRMLEKGV